MNEFIKNVRAWAESIPDVRSVILYGSRARGDYQQDSDWDICILVEDSNVGNSAWYGLWIEKADSWHKSFCDKTGLKISDVQFVVPTNDIIKDSIAECSKVLYVRDTVNKI